jgi:regulator of sirC expression with transglutaminase-like and TPR domain
MKKYALILLLLLLLQPKLLFPENVVLDDIENLLKLPENKLDVVVAKLAIDNIMEPSIDIKTYLTKRNELVKTIKAYSSGQQINLEEINNFLYKAGKWNNFQPYSLDFDDLAGVTTKNYLLSNYMDTKKGNALSMSVLYYSLCEKFKIDVYYAYAPRHLFIKVKDIKEKLWNIDPSRGGISVDDSWYIEKFSISKKALQNKVYLQPLTNKEAVAVLVARLVPFYLQKKDFQTALYVCDLSWYSYSKNVDVIADKGAIYQLMYENELATTDKNLMTDSEKEYLDWLNSQAKKYFKMAEDLGWTPEPQEDIRAYLQEIKETKEVSIK